MDSSILICSKCNDSDTRLWNSLIDIRSKPKVVIKYSIGTFVKIGETQFILSCYHGLQHSIEINLYQFKKSKGRNFTINKIPLTLQCYSDELDLAILTVGEDINVIHPLNLDGFSFDLSITDDELKVNYDETRRVSETAVSKKEVIMMMTVKGIVFERYNSYNMPKLPYVKCTVKDLSDDKISVIKGLSGILCRDSNNAIVGMLMNYNRDDNCIRLVPSIVLINFMNSFINTGKYEGVKGIVFKKSQCNFNHNGADFSGIIVNDVYNSKYYVGIKKDDIVFKINDKDIDRNYNVYDETTSIPILYETYISLKSETDDAVKLTVMRQDPVLNDYKEVEVYVKPETLHKLRNIQLSHNDAYFNFGGFVFTELSENIIDFYRNHGIQLMGEVFKRHAINNYGNYEQSKTIVLVNIVNTEFNNVDLLNVISKGLPLSPKKGTKNQYYMCVLNTVNKKKVTCLEDIKKYLMSDKNSFKFILDDNVKLSVNYGETNLSITYIVK